MIALDRLENVRTTSGKTTARCPACAEAGGDRAGDHLVLLASGKFGCVNHPGPQGRVHRQRVFELVGEKTASTPARQRTAAPRPAPIPRPPSPLPTLEIDLRRPTCQELADLAHLRGWPVYAGLDVAVDRGILRSTTMIDGGETRAAWVITDASRHAAQARRLDGQLWQGIAAKAKTLKGSCAAWPVGAAAIGDRKIVFVCEGAPDLLASLTCAWLGEIAADVAVVAMLGAGQRIHPGALPLFAGRHISIVEQNDDAARRAGKGWASQLRPIAASISGWEPPGPDKDIADMLRRLAGEHEDLDRLAGAIAATQLFDGVKGVSRD